MSYYFTKKITDSSFKETEDRVKEVLKSKGFGVLTEIDVKETFRKKLDIDFRNYRILGACNPNFAHKAIESEANIGVFLPCNVILQEWPDGNIEVSAVDPIASMTAVENSDLGDIASEVQKLMKEVVEEL